MQPRHKLLRHIINLVGIHAGKGVRILPLILIRCARADIENRQRPKEREEPGNSAEFAHQSPGHELNRGPYLRGLQECQKQALI